MSGYIYKCFKNDNKDIFYIGSTKNYNQRINSHRSNSKYNTTFFRNYVRENGGFDNFTFEIYEEITDCDSDKLLIREKEIIELLKPYLNTDKDIYRKEICMKARRAKAEKKKIMDENKIEKKKGRPPKNISNENKNEKSTQTDFNELSTQTEFMSLSNNEIIKLRKIINLIKC